MVRYWISYGENIAVYILDSECIVLPRWRILDRLVVAQIRGPLYSVNSLTVDNKTLCSFSRLCVTTTIDSCGIAASYTLQELMLVTSCANSSKPRSILSYVEEHSISAIGAVQISTW